MTKSSAVSVVPRRHLDLILEVYHTNRDPSASGKLVRAIETATKDETIRLRTGADTLLRRLDVINPHTNPHHRLHPHRRGLCTYLTLTRIETFEPSQKFSR